MPSLRYQVAVVHQGRHYFAYLFDLQCQASGATADEAVAHVYEQARDVLQGYEGGSLDPPLASDLTIATVELPTPNARERSNDASAA